MLADHDDFLRDFRAVYRAHYGLVWHTLVRFGVESPVVEDAVQDVFVVAYRRRHDRSGRSIKGWLYGIARRVAANYRRGDQRRAHRHDELRASLSTMCPQGVHEAIHELDRYLSSLGTADRELFILSELEGMSGPEIAEVRGRKVQTIYTRIRKLRNDFAADVDFDRARAARPRASARSWGMLVPIVAPVKPVAAAGLTAVLGSGWFLGSLAVAATMVIAVGLTRTDASQGSRPPAEIDADGTRPGLRPASPPTLASPPRRPPTPAPASPALASPALASPPEPSNDPARDVPARTTRPSPQPREQPAARDARGTTDSLDDDNELLRRVSRALAEGRAGAALQLADEHARRFPASPLSDLRTAVRIDALCRRGDLERARHEAAAFLDAHPSSPVVLRIGKSCGILQEKPSSADTTQP